MHLSFSSLKRLKTSNPYLSALRQAENNLFLFLISMLTGCFLTNSFLETILYTAWQQFHTTTELILTISGKKEHLLFYYFFLHIRVFFLLIFFSYTNVWKIYYRIFLCYTGMVQGILFSFCLHKNRLFSGIIEYICFLIPQVLLLAPLYLFCFLSFGKMNDKLFGAGTKKQKRELLLKQFPIYVIAVFVLFISSFLEAYINLPLLQRIL